MTSRLPIFASLVFALFLSATTQAAQRVLVLPFTPLNNSETTAWIGPAVQENIVADLSRDGAVSAVVYKEALASPDLASAVKAGQQASALQVIFGSYQTVGTEIRITASIVDIPAAELRGTAKATGPSDKLLSLEDTLSEQIRATVLGQPATQPSPPSPQTTAGQTLPMDVLYSQLQPATSNATNPASTVGQPVIINVLPSPYNSPMVPDYSATSNYDITPYYSYPPYYYYPTYYSYPIYGGYPFSAFCAGVSFNHFNNFHHSNFICAFPQRSFSTSAFHNSAFDHPAFTGGFATGGFGRPAFNGSSFGHGMGMGSMSSFHGGGGGGMHR